MPLYEYECLKCGHRFERIQKFSDKPVSSCPKCKKGKVKQLLSASSFHLKGSGWYATDYAGKDKGKSESSTEGAEESVAKDSDKADKEKKDKPEKKDKGDKSDKSEKSDKKESKPTEKKKEPAAKS